VRARLLVSAVLSAPRRRNVRLAIAASAVATAAAVTPVLAGSTPSAVADASTSVQIAELTLTAPPSVTRGTGATLAVKLDLDGVPLPERTVQFLDRTPGVATWQVLGSATTGVDGTTTLPVQALDAATEFGATYSDVNGTVRSNTASTAVHVIDLHPHAPRVVAYKAPVTIAAHLVQDGTHGLAGQAVQVRFRPGARHAWSSPRVVRTNSAGTATIAGRFTRSFQVGIKFPGAGGLAPSPFAVRTVHVTGGSPTGFRFPFLHVSQATSPGSWSLDQGVDIFAKGEACGAAAKLVAVGDGTVIQTGISGFGPTAPVIRMSSGPFRGRNVYYGHTGHIYVHVGQHVHAGDLVAQIGCGSVGYSSAPHLEIGVGVAGGPPCCPGFGQTARQMYRQMELALRSS